MKANQIRAQTAALRPEDKDQKARDFEAAKRELLAFHDSALQKASGAGR